MILHTENETGIEDDRVMRPHLSTMVDLKKSEQLHGLSERIVAVESLVYLASQYQALQEFMEYLIPQSNKYMLEQFFEQVSDMVEVYGCVRKDRNGFESFFCFVDFHSIWYILCIIFYIANRSYPKFYQKFPLMCHRNSPFDLLQSY